MKKAFDGDGDFDIMRAFVDERLPHMKDQVLGSTLRKLLIVVF